MDVQTIDSQYQQLQSQSQQTSGAIGTLAQKLQAAAQGGNQDAREWLLDLKGVALAFQAEQNQVALLLQALHAFVANQQQLAAMPQQAQPSPWGAPPPAQPGYYPPQQPQQPGYYPPQGGGAGGLLGGLLNSSFGRAVEMGAGFGIGDDLINKIF